MNSAEPEVWCRGCGTLNARGRAGVGVAQASAAKLWRTPHRRLQPLGDFYFPHPSHPPHTSAGRPCSATPPIPFTPADHTFPFCSAPPTPFTPSTSTPSAAQPDPAAIPHPSHPPLLQRDLPRRQRLCPVAQLHHAARACSQRHAWGGAAEGCVSRWGLGQGGMGLCSL